MPRKPEPSDTPACLQCGHPFAAVELAALTALEGHEDLCVIDCAACGAHNIGRAQPRAGMDHHPSVVVLRIAARDPKTGKIFHETVEPGVRVDRTTAGESH